MSQGPLPEGLKAHVAVALQYNKNRIVSSLGVDRDTLSEMMRPTDSVESVGRILFPKSYCKRR